MSTQLSDFNSTTAPISKVAHGASKLSADLDLRFILHPAYNDIRPITDIDAIKQAVKNLILTNHGERPFQPEIGGNITRLLFEPADVFVIAEMEEEIKDVINRHEKRVNDVAVRVDFRPDINSLHVAVQFNVVGKQEAQSMEFYLERLR